jgi:hypothetical protein
MTAAHLCFTIGWPDSGFYIAGVVVIPSNAVSAMCRDPVFHLGPDGMDACLCSLRRLRILLYLVFIFLDWILLLRVLSVFLYLHVLFCVW